MSPPTPTARRVLMPLDPNTAVGVVGEPAKPTVRSPGTRAVGEVQNSDEVAIPAPNRGAGHAEKTERVLAAGSHQGESREESSPKRRKLDVSPAAMVPSPAPITAAAAVLVGNKEPQPTSANSLFESQASEATTGDGEVDVGGSQETNMTVPDEGLTVEVGAESADTQEAAKPPLETPEDMKKRTRAMAQKLHLSLSIAHYKVSTNQIDVPLSRLEVRSSYSFPERVKRIARTYVNVPNTYREGDRSAVTMRKPLPERWFNSPNAEPASVKQSKWRWRGGNSRNSGRASREEDEDDEGIIELPAAKASAAQGHAHAHPAADTQSSPNRGLREQARKGLESVGASMSSNTARESEREQRPRTQHDAEDETRERGGAVDGLLSLRGGVGV